MGPAYRVEGHVGHGGFAEVWEARDVALDRRVAIKVLRGDVVASPGILERFQREARAVAALRHPNVIEIYAVGDAEGVAYLVMPFVEGETLGDLLDREGALPLDEVRRILVDAARALGVAHAAGIVHRDVKPDNILLDGPDRRVLLTDFGIAKALVGEDVQLTGSGAVLGTPQYMSPEQAVGDPVDHRTDVYSLGVLAHRMITGALPFDGASAQAIVVRHLTEPPPDPRSARPDCPDHLAAVVSRCLAKDPGERWASMSELVDGVEGRLAPAEVQLTGVAGWDGAAPPSVAGSATAREALEALEAPVRSFQRAAVLAGLGVVALVVVDAAVGLAGVSLWIMAGAAGWVTVQASRLWTAGYEWRDLVLPGALDVEARAVTLRGSTTGELDDYGRHGSLVRRCVRDRALVLRAFGELPHEIQARFPELHGVLEHLVARVKHLARKVGTLEERMAEAAGRRTRDGRDPSLSSERERGWVQELAAARDDAARELRALVDVLEAVHAALGPHHRHDPLRAEEELTSLLQEARLHLTHRARIGG